MSVYVCISVCVCESVSVYICVCVSSCVSECVCLCVCVYAPPPLQGQYNTSSNLFPPPVASRKVADMY